MGMVLLDRGGPAGHKDHSLGLTHVGRSRQQAALLILEVRPSVQPTNGMTVDSSIVDTTKSDLFMNSQRLSHSVKSRVHNPNQKHSYNFCS